MLGFRSQYPKGSPDLWQNDYKDIANYLQSLGSYVQPEVALVRYSCVFWLYRVTTSSVFRLVQFVAGSSHVSPAIVGSCEKVGAVLCPRGYGIFCWLQMVSGIDSGLYYGYKGTDDSPMSLGSRVCVQLSLRPCSHDAARLHAVSYVEI
jgi:hypothetical protein